MARHSPELLAVRMSCNERRRTAHSGRPFRQLLVYGWSREGLGSTEKGSGSGGRRGGASRGEKGGFRKVASSCLIHRHISADIYIHNTPAMQPNIRGESMKCVETFVLPEPVVSIPSTLPFLTPFALGQNLSFVHLCDLQWNFLSVSATISISPMSHLFWPSSIVGSLIIPQANEARETQRYTSLVGLSSH